MICHGYSLAKGKRSEVIARISAVAVTEMLGQRVPNGGRMTHKPAVVDESPIVDPNQSFPDLKPYARNI